MRVYCPEKVYLLRFTHRLPRADTQASGEDYLGSNMSLNWQRWVYLVFVEFVHRDCLFFIMMTSLM